MRIGLVAFLCACVCLDCTEFENANPYDPLYKGDYLLAIDTAGSEVDLDSLEPMRPYRLALRRGVDGYARFTCNAPIDTGLFAASFRGGSSAVLYFVETFRGTVVISGVRPNEAVDTDSFNVVVGQPYRIDGPGVMAMGERASYRVLRVDGQAAARGDSLRVAWWAGEPETLGIADTFSTVALEDCQVRASLVDIRGNGLRFDSLQLRVPGLRPIINAVEFGDSVHAGDTITARADVTFGVGSRFAVFVTAGTGTVADSVIAVISGRTLTARATEPVRDTGYVAFTARVVDEAGLSSPVFTRFQRIYSAR